MVARADWPAGVLAGTVVQLEPLGAEHEEALWTASSDARAWQWLSSMQPQTREELRAWVAEARGAASQDREIPFVTRRVADGAVIGSTRFLALRREHRSVEIGWTWLHPDAWGTGANVEAKLLMLAHAFDTWGCRRVELKTDAGNERARGALEALGATFEGVHRQHMLVREGENRDSAWYSILDHEWPRVRAAGLDRLANAGSPNLAPGTPTGGHLQGSGPPRRGA